ncbi:Uncharacterised protein [Mycobacteroides abscessus subsp. massiliense]|nr:Uncharacterised protein [Mycobacteroides abscessus subsp. massiliense]
MINPKTGAIQLSSRPKMCCHTSTDSPNAAPSDSSTVPTMTSEATSARVMIIITAKISVTAAIPTINRS